MNHQRPSRGLALLAVAFALLVVPSLAAAGTTPDKSKPAPLYWPEGGHEQLRFITTEKLFDNIPLKVGRLSGAGIEWENQFHDEWDPLAITPPQYSIAFRQRSGTPLTFAVTVFGKDEFLANLRDEQWARYLQALAEKHGDSFQILSESSALEDPSAGLMILGEPARELVYTRRAYPSGVIAELDVFVMKGGRPIAFSLIGPQKLVTEKADAFRLMIFQIADLSKQ